MDTIIIGLGTRSLLSRSFTTSMKVKKRFCHKKELKKILEKHLTKQKGNAPIDPPNSDNCGGLMKQSKTVGSSKPGVTGRIPGKKKTPPNLTQKLTKTGTVAVK